MVSESWFRNLWRTQQQNESSPFIGVLTFEVANLMTKLNHLWKSLSDKQVANLRKEILNSLGIRKLVFNDDDHVASLICAEMMDNLDHVSKAVARLASKCEDVNLKRFKNAFGDLMKVDMDLYGWQLSYRKMDKKVKKLERFIIVNSSLHQELELLTDLEHSLRRMKAGEDFDSISLLEYEKKVAWKRQEVKQLKEISFWNKTYDYVVSLLARCVFTIYRRIGHVFGTNCVTNPDTKNSSGDLSLDFMDRSQSVSAMMQSSIHPSENSSIPRFSSGPIEKWITKTDFFSGPLGRSTAMKSDQILSRKKKLSTFFSGPIEKSSRGSGSFPSKLGFRLWGSHFIFLPFQGKSSHSKQKNQPPIGGGGPFGGCIIEGSNSSIRNCHQTVSHSLKSAEKKNLQGITSGDDNNLPKTGQKRYLKPPPETLGASALSLHYANVIIVIEKLATSPHLIGQDARDDLYSMLPSSIRSALRKKLKPHAKSSVCDTGLAQEWNNAISGILEWLAPLAHNMIRWQSERSFEHQNIVSRTNVFLVQTLFMANQEKTEAAITELLVGLNYIWRLGRELSANAVLEYSSDRMLHNSLNLEGL
ncbi:uncharacterized protein LOC124919882 [Impatiens glandulifera]|uniref:uncharacterized protein LOC124919882 n=1 Tax=Impatiens glandulifera TaxID=253017 RepID=UPI001FB0C321|nr:uncharacterized protein LOC124919882 [Impatiens glandulifera]XP_047316203.1 uncharacterized protein LOC124919882 [Impatiens glandulifera]